MPNLTEDNSIAAVVWRGRLKTGGFNLKALKGENESMGSFRSNTSSNYMIPTALGLRDGVPDNQTADVGYLQRQQLNPYPTSKSPFLSQSVEDVYPRVYGQANPMGGTNGEIKEVASMGGSPLAITLDINQLAGRLRSESLRNDKNNPLSQAFAVQAISNAENDPVKGPLTDIMRYGVKADFEDQSILKQKMATGFLQQGLVEEKAFIGFKRRLDDMRDIYNQDVNDFKDLFTKQAGDLGGIGNVQQRLDSIANQINSFSIPGSSSSNSSAVSSNNNRLRTGPSRNTSSINSRMTNASASPSSSANTQNNFPNLSNFFSTQTNPIFRRNSAVRQAPVPQPSASAVVSALTNTNVITPTTPSLNAQALTTPQSSRRRTSNTPSSAGGTSGLSLVSSSAPIINSSLFIPRTPQTDTRRNPNRNPRLTPI